MSAIKKREFYIKSDCPDHKLHCISWEPESGEIRAVLQIVHGMVEYADRYHDFAVWLAGHGIAVLAHDHLGHGKTAETDEDLGYFAKRGGDQYVIADMYRMTVKAKALWPGKPLIILGHSMGSFFTRKYLTRYSRKVDGAIIMGTGHYPLLLADVGLLLSTLICMIRGGHYRSNLLYQLSIGNNNRRITDPRTENDWLTREEEIVDRYCADPYCSFRFTASAYRDFFRILRDLAKKKGFQTMNRSLPVLLVSGEEDPVGSYGRGVRTCCRQFQSLKFHSVTLKLYPEARHEVINETNRLDVYKDIEEWIAAVAEEKEDRQE